jgi:hypothetical protein
LKIFFKVALLILAVIALILIAVMVFLRTLFPTPLSKEATEKDFAKNRDNILLVTHYLINCQDDSVYIHNADSEEITNIEDLQVVDAIKTLFGKGYSLIAKNGDTIHFQRSTRLMDFQSGIAYSIDGSEPQLPYLTKLDPLSDPNWYYYEADFNEFKKRDQSQ